MVYTMHPNDASRVVDETEEAVGTPTSGVLARQLTAQRLADPGAAADVELSRRMGKSASTIASL